MVTRSKKCESYGGAAMADRDDADLAAEMRAVRLAVQELTAELRRGRERKATTRRVKSARRARQVKDIPVDDVAAMAARRALAKLGM
jgi:hypothetical protein